VLQTLSLICNNSQKQQPPALSKRIRRQLIIRMQKGKKDYDFGVGDKVLLSTKDFKPPEDKERRKKQAAKFAGPYGIVSPVAYKCLLPPAQTLIHTPGD
jgi:hypothetical protein